MSLEHDQENDKILISAEQLALHLLKQHNISNVKVLPSHTENAYDYKNKKIILAEDVIHKKSIRALTIAAHEFGHACQHSSMNYSFLLSVSFSKLARVFRVLSIISFLISLVVIVFWGNRLLIYLVLLAYLTPGILNFMLSILALPVEFEASFIYAYPILKEGKYLAGEDLDKAKKLLFAASMTYVVQAFANIFSIFNLFSKNAIKVAGI